MLPNLPSPNLVDGCNIHSVFSSKVANRPAIVGLIADCADIVLSQFRRMISDPDNRVSLFCHHVSNIINSAAKEKMGGTHTRLIVASVQYPDVQWNFTTTNNPRYLMCIAQFSSNRELPIPCFRSASRPSPTWAKLKPDSRAILIDFLQNLSSNVLMVYFQWDIVPPRKAR